MRLRTAALLLSLCLPSLLVAGELRAAEPQTWQEFRDDTGREWDARAVVASGRGQVRSRFFAGEVDFAEAFPGLIDVRIEREDVVRGRLLALDEAAIRRAAEAAAPLPADAPARVLAELGESRARALEAETEADAHERRLLVGVAARLALHPELTEAGLKPLRAQLEQVGSEDGSDEAAVARSAAQRDAQRAALERLVRELLVGGAVPERPVSVAVESPLDDPSAARLALALPFLGESRRSDVEEQLVAYWGGPRRVAAESRLRAAREAGSLDLDAASAARLVAELEAQSAPVPQPIEGNLVSIGRVMVLAMEQEALALELAAARDALTRAAGAAKRAEVNAAGEVRRAQAEAEAAFEAAAEARRVAEDAAGVRRAELLQARADAQVRAAELWQQVEVRETEAEALSVRHTTTLVELGARIRQVEARRSLDPDRPDPDALYVELRRELDDLRAEPVARGLRLDEALALERDTLPRVTAERQQLAEARELLDAAPEAERAELAAALTDWDAALVDELRAVQAIVSTTTSERDALLEALQRGRKARRRLLPWISASARESDGRTLFIEVSQELALLQPEVTSRLRRRFEDVRSVPGHLLDTRVLRDLVVGSLWTFVLIGLWLWGRAWAPSWTRSLTARLSLWRSELRPADLAVLQDPGTRALRALIDLLLGWSLIDRVGDLVVELGFVLLVYLQVALYRFVLAAFELAVVRPSDFRPALLVLRPRTWQLARHTVRAATAYFIVRAFVSRLLWDVLGLDRVESVASSLFSLAAVGLAVLGLWAWAPVIQDRARARVSEATGGVAWLLREDSGHIMRVIRALGGLGIVVMGLVSEVGDWITRTRLGTSWVVNAVSRYRLQPQEDSVAVPVAPSVMHALAERPSRSEEFVVRPEVDAQFDAAWASWNTKRRQGLVALCGDRGEGKSSTLDRLRARLEADGASVTELRVPQGLRDERMAVAMLAEVLGLDEVESVEQVVERIEAAPSRVVFLEGMHHAYTRCVGGFEALNALLYVMNATSDHVFWVAAVHRPAWWYLASVGSMVDVGIFPTVIDLPPWSVDDLRSLALARTEACGLLPDFSGLVRTSALGGDPEVERERSERTFFRLLVEVCDGNPHVGLHLYARSLQSDPEQPDHVRVTVGAALSNAVHEGLTDAALFVLVAVRLQERLSESELPGVTNLSTVAVRRTVRDLLMRGLLERTEEGVRIPTAQLPLVNRTLRRRHFLHLGA